MAASTTPKFRSIGPVLALEVADQRGLDLIGVDAQQLDQRADVDHVGDIGAQVGVGAGVLGHLLHRQIVVGDVGAVLGDVELGWGRSARRLARRA